MYKKIIFFLIIAAICTSVNAQIKSLVIKKLDASFSMKNGLVLVNGSFDKGIAAVQYNAAKPVYKNHQAKLFLMVIIVENHMR